MFRSAFHVFILSIILLSSPLAAQEGIRQVSSYYNIWDEAYDIAVRGDYAYLATGFSGLQVVDISDHENPEVVSHMEIVDNATWIEIIDDFVYIGIHKLYGCHHIDFSVIDISDPASPGFVRQVEVGGENISGFSRDDNTACFTSWTYRFNFPEPDEFWGEVIGFNIEQRDNPTLLFSRLTDDPHGPPWIGRVTSPLIRGNILYLKIESSYICVLDISDPQQIEILAQTQIAGYPLDSNSDNNVIYAKDGQQGILIINSADPQDLELLGEYNDLGLPINLIADDTLIYATFPDSIFGVINAAEPDSPELLGELQIDKQFTRFDLGDGFAASITGPRDFKLIDISDAENPEISGSYSHPEGIVNGIDKVGNFVYVTLGEQGFSILDVSEIENLRELSRINTAGEAMKVEVQDSYAYVADDDSGMCIINISNPENPNVVSQFTAFEDTAYTKTVDITIEGDYAYLTTDAGIKIINIDNPEHPWLVGQIEPGKAIQIIGNLAYVSGKYVMRVLDISDKSDPRLLHSWRFDEPMYGYKVANNYLICCVQIGRSVGNDYIEWVEIVIHDISDLDNIRQVSNEEVIHEYGHIKCFRVKHDYAYIVYDNRLIVWDISNFEQMHYVGHHDFEGVCNDLEIDGTTVYSANQSNLDVYDCSEVVKVAEDDLLSPYSFVLHPAYPNPFNSTTTLTYQLPTASDVSLKIFDVTGREVTSLVGGRMESGRHQIVWNRAGVPSGIYICRLTAGEYARYQKLALVK